MTCRPWGCVTRIGLSKEDNVVQPDGGLLHGTLLVQRNPFACFAPMCCKRELGIAVLPSLFVYLQVQHNRY